MRYRSRRPRQDAPEAAVGPAREDATPNGGLCRGGARPSAPANVGDTATGWPPTLAARPHHLPIDCGWPSRWATPGPREGFRTAAVAASSPSSAIIGAHARHARRVGPENDREVLEGLYDATGGEDWTDSASWKTSAPLSEWFGVTTDDADRVTALSLYDNGLVGPIPGWLANLTGLRSLELGGNALTGPIPDALGNLANPQSLSLGWNEPSGPIPSGLGRLAQPGVVAPLRERVDRPDSGCPAQPGQSASPGAQP